MNSAEPTFIMVLSKLYSKILFLFFIDIFISVLLYPLVPDKENVI